LTANQSFANPAIITYNSARRSFAGYSTANHYRSARSAVTAINNFWDLQWSAVFRQIGWHGP